jgi:hypothetical protein
MGRDSLINDATLVKRSLNLLGAMSIKHGLDLLGVASGQCDVDEKKLQRR